MKTVCWGSPNIKSLPDWMKTGVVFNEPDNLYAFGLRALTGATKAFQIVLEAFVLKHLMFEGKASKQAEK